jgi:hypothetical protein
MNDKSAADMKNAIGRQQTGNRKARDRRSLCRIEEWRKNKPLKDGVDDDGPAE